LIAFSSLGYYAGIRALLLPLIFLIAISFYAVVVAKKWKEFDGSSVAECRINAEDPDTFMPSPGTIDVFHAPGGPGIRVDSHIYQSYVVSPFYDSLIGKIISYGDTREIAIAKMRNALKEIVIEGIKTNIPLHQRILEDKKFLRGRVNIHHLDNFCKNKK